MNNKKFFAFSLPLLLSPLIAGCSNSGSATASHKIAQKAPETAHRLDAGDFSNAVPLTRDELKIDLKSINTTPASKSVTVNFNSSRLTGYGTTSKGSYVVIDDPDYSGSPTDASLSGNVDPEYGVPSFNGYTIEMTDKATFTLSCTEVASGDSISRKDFIVPSIVEYSGSFVIKNHSILKDSLVFDGEEYGKASFDYFIIPEGIERIEAGAIQLMPVAYPEEKDGEDVIRKAYEGVKIVTPYASRPAGWEDGWLTFSDGSVVTDADVEWGYQLIDETSELYTKVSKTNNEVTNCKQNTGTNINYYGELETAVSNDDNSLFALIDDVNFSGDLVNPLRTTEGRTAPYHLSAYVNEMVDTEVDVVIPSQISYAASDIVLDVKSIKPRILSLELDDEKNHIGALKNIYIPATIETIDSNAFRGLTDDVNIYCEAASKPDLWSDSWIPSNFPSANVHWGSVIPAAKINVNAGDEVRQYRTSNEADTYIIGYVYEKENTYYSAFDKAMYTKDELKDGKSPTGHDVIEVEDTRPAFNLPLVVSYTVNKNGGGSRTVTEELKVQSSEDGLLNPFDSVKTSTFAKSIDVLIESDETLDANSFVFYNIYRATTTKILTKQLDTETGELVEKMVSYTIPDTSVSFSSTSLKRFDKEINIDQIIKYKFNGVTSFGDYTNISMLVDKVLPSFYFEGMDPAFIESNRVFIDSGEYSVRYAIYDVSSSFYRISYQTSSGLKEKRIAVKTPNPVIILEADKGNNISFLINNASVGSDFSAGKLRRFELIGLTLNIHLWNNKNSSKVSRSDLSMHFGAIDIMPERTSSPAVFSVVGFLVTFFVIYTIAFAGGAVGLYFFLKNKYKNDEFRRMNTKKYIKSAIIFYLGVAVVLLTILAVIMRTGVMMSSVSVHNPIDILIVIPGIISIVAIGYFVKFTYGKIKANKHRKKIKKLKIDQDVNDDGTN